MVNQLVYLLVDEESDESPEVSPPVTSNSSLLSLKFLSDSIEDDRRIMQEIWRKDFG